MSIYDNLTMNKTQLRYRTCFSSISHSGYKLDILKSAMQKYLRRKEKSKMIWCVAEIYLFHVFAKSEQEKKATKGIITNMLNRLIIMMDEEMIFAEVQKYLVLRKLLEKFEEGGRNDFIYLYKICDILINARILRVNSDIRAYWDYRFRHDKQVYKDDDITSEDDEASFKEFVKEFNEGSYGCYYYMFKIFNGARETPGIKWFKTKKENIYKIWYYLFKRKVVMENWILRKNLEYKLIEFHKKKRGERFMWLSSAIQLVLNADKLGLNKVMYEINGKKIIKNMYENHVNKTKEEKMEIIKEVFENRKKLIIDDYCIDQHCSKGRVMGKGKKDWKTKGSLVVDEDKEYFVQEWRNYYRGKWKKQAEQEEKKVEPKKTRAEIRAEKYKRIKKMRGKPNFDDLEKNLRFVDGIDESKIILCSDVTCGNKVMCFEYEGKIWKESRKSMFYNRDYIVVDNCKELFGLKKIGMERVLSNFRIEKIDKSKKEWKNNWHKVIIGKDEEKVVYCVMNKITNCMWKVPMEIGEIKHSLVYGVENGGNIGQNRRLFKEFVKIGVYRGIFRCSDFNCRNVLVGLEDQFSPQYLVSIDEGDIGKRLDILGGRERWIINGLNADKTIINEILVELSYQASVIMCLEKMEKYKFGIELRNEVENNWKNLRKDLEAEGVEFD